MENSRTKLKFSYYKANRIYKENLRSGLIDYIIQQVYKYKRKPRSMSTNQKEDPFRNIIREKKENDQKEKTELQEYKMKLLHTSRNGKKDQLNSFMKSEIFGDLTENEQLYYAKILKNMK